MGLFEASDAHVVYCPLWTNYISVALVTDPKSRVRPSRVAVTGLLDRVSVRNFDIRPSITLLKAAGVLGHTFDHA